MTAGHKFLTTTVLWLGLALATALPWAGCGFDGPTKEHTRAAKYVAAGDEYLAQGSRKKAVAPYTRAAELYPDGKKAYACLAMALGEMNRRQEALADYTKAIQIAPHGSFPFERRAAIYRDVLRDDAKAKADDDRPALIRQKRWKGLQKLTKER
jgi:tetratricopeptide (TPR) repeat protein